LSLTPRVSFDEAKLLALRRRLNVSRTRISFAHHPPPTVAGTIAITVLHQCCIENRNYGYTKFEFHLNYSVHVMTLKLVEISAGLPLLPQGLGHVEREMSQLRVCQRLPRWPVQQFPG
jgi:hypothetical protein